MLSAGERTWVTGNDKRMGAEVVVIQPRNMILKLDDGRFAKLVRVADPERPRRTEDPRIIRVKNLRSRMVSRFLRRQTHPGLLRVHERVVGERGEVGFVCEALVSHHISRGMAQHPLTRSFRLFLEGGVVLGGALGVLHRSGRVHADVTPHNVLLRGLVPVLIDFEMSVRIGQYASEEPNKDSGEITATPACCSPEHATRKPMKAASDVYCLGLTMLSWITGHFGVAHIDGVGHGYNHVLHLCAAGEYPHWRLVEDRLVNLDVLDLFQDVVRLNHDRAPRDGDEFAVRCQLLLQTLPESVLNKAIIKRHDPSSAEPPRRDQVGAAQAL
ncbi:MAG: protein kinase [Parcubacteria group bacterium]|nr:protein kinase [Parcubacteria group bacterium]